MLLQFLLMSPLIQAPAVQGPVDCSLKGLDPVALTHGVEIAGDAARTIERNGHTYAFANDENKERFRSDPSRFEIQMGGGCARMGPLSGSCSSHRFAVHEGHIYLFASDACRDTFLKDPARFLYRDDPALEASAAERAAGWTLMDKVLLGMGGAERVDAVKTYRWDKLAQQESGGQSYATRESALYRLPDDLRRESAWDDSTWFDVDTPSDGFKGPKTVATLHADARAELRRQLGRDPLYLARHRTRADFEVAAAGTGKVGAKECDLLVVRHAGVRTTLCVEPESGRVLRTSWRGRLGTGGNGEVTIDYSDFRPVAGLVLPHARQVSSDGKPVATLSGALDKLEVDADLPDALFAR